MVQNEHYIHKPEIYRWLSLGNTCRLPEKEKIPKVSFVLLRLRLGFDLVVNLALISCINNNVKSSQKQKCMSVCEKEIKPWNN